MDTTFRVAPPPRKTNNSKGFTLSEVLITLSILGVVAGITIPAIVHRIQDRVEITQLKAAYSIIENGLRMMYVEKGDPRYYNWPGGNGGNESNANFFANMLKDYLPVSKYCGSDTGCLPTKDDSMCKDGNKAYYHTLNRQCHSSSYNMWSDHLKYGKMILKNGMMISINILRPKMDYDYSIGQIRVDLNGKKGPNAYGHDVFSFGFDQNGIQTSFHNYTLSKDGKYGGHKDVCRISSTENNNGISCSLWVLKHNNMDYKYRDIYNDW